MPARYKLYLVAQFVGIESFSRWLLSLPDGRKDAELLEQAQVVIGVPMLDDLAAREAEDFDARDFHALPGWGIPRNIP